MKDGGGKERERSSGSWIPEAGEEGRGREGGRGQVKQLARDAEYTLIMACENVEEGVGRRAQCMKGDGSERSLT